MFVKFICNMLITCFAFQIENTVTDNIVLNFGEVTHLTL